METTFDYSGQLVDCHLARSDNGLAPPICNQVNGASDWFSLTIPANELNAPISLEPISHLFSPSIESRQQPVSCNRENWIMKTVFNARSAFAPDLRAEE